MDEPITWRELYRTDDLLRARAVVTAIAAMEFDVRLATAEGALADAMTDEQAAADFPGPYVVEVPQEHWTELSTSLNEIVDEQEEFDSRLEARQDERSFRLTSAFKLAAGVLAIFIGWRLLMKWL